MSRFEAIRRLMQSDPLPTSLKVNMRIEAIALVLALIPLNSLAGEPKVDSNFKYTEPSGTYFEASATNFRWGTKYGQWDFGIPVIYLDEVIRFRPNGSSEKRQTYVVPAASCNTKHGKGLMIELQSSTTEPTQLLEVSSEINFDLRDGIDQSSVIEPIVEYECRLMERQVYREKHPGSTLQTI